MPGGTSKGKIDDRFFAQCQALSTQSGGQAGATLSATPRPWQDGDVATWSGDPLDITGMAAAFDRSAIGTNFAELYADPASPGTIGDANSLRIQADYLAAMERAFRVSRASLPRTELFAAGRRRGQGTADGTLQDGVIRYAQDLITAGQQ